MSETDPTTGERRAEVWQLTAEVRRETEILTACFTELARRAPDGGHRRRLARRGVRLVAEFRTVLEDGARKRLQGLDALDAGVDRLLAEPPGGTGQ